MGSSAFFHSSSRFYQRHRKSYQTGRLRIEESTYIRSVKEEEEFLHEHDDNIINKIIKVVETTGKQYIRLIPFDATWNLFWNSIKKHFFVFEEHKVAVVYFYNTETQQYIGPLYDAGPRFDQESCKRRYSIYLKEAVVNNLGNESIFIKVSNLHQFSIPPLNQSHFQTHSFSELHSWNYFISPEQVNLNNLQGEQRVRQNYTQPEEVTEEAEVTGTQTLTRPIINGKKLSITCLRDYPLCKFTSNDKGATYNCGHCQNKIQRRQKNRLILLRIKSQSYV